MRRLRLRDATYDSFRQSVVIPLDGGQGEVSVGHDALEILVNRRLTAEEAVICAIEEGVALRFAANATPADDGMIVITNSVLNSREWEIGEYAE